MAGSTPKKKIETKKREKMKMTKKRT